MKRLLFAVLASALLTAPASAHHSITAAYNIDREVMIEGELVLFLFRNPHSFVQVMAPDEHGVVQRWSIEWAAAGQLTEIKRDTLKAGDHVVVTANPGRNPGDHRARMKSIVRPSDGFKWGGTFE
jgi:hypothetical protein